MAFSHGSNAVLKVADSGSTLRDLSDYLTQDGLAREAETAETTTKGNAASNGARTYIPGLSDGTIPLEGNFDTVVDGYLAGIWRTETTFEYYPTGEGSGNVKYSGSAILTSYEIDSPFDDTTTFSGELQITGAITRALVP